MNQHGINALESISRLFKDKDFLSGSVVKHRTWRKHEAQQHRVDARKEYRVAGSATQFN